jgi:hypothetical protein
MERNVKPEADQEPRPQPDQEAAPETPRLGRLASALLPRSLSQRAAADMAKLSPGRRKLNQVLAVVFGIAVVAVGAHRLYACATGADRAKVQVACGPSTSGLECTVAHVEGGAEAEACWNVVLTCANGLRVASHACRTVQPKQSVKHYLGVGQFPNMERCDRGVAYKVEDLEVAKP